MDPAPVDSRRPSRWLAVLWVLGTIAAITVSVVAVRIAGAQVEARHSARLSTTEVADAVTASQDDQADDSSTGDDVGDDSGHAPGDDDGGRSGDSSTSAVSGNPGSLDASSDGGGSSGPGSGDDHPSTTTAPGDSSGPGSGGSGGGGDGGGGSSGPGHDGTVTTTTTGPPLISTYIKATAGGVVVVLCTGGNASLVSVTASLGWPVDIRNRGPQEVEVRLGEHGDQITVKARCSGGLVNWG